MQSEGKAVLNIVHRKKIQKISLLSIPPPPTPAAWTCRVYPFFKCRNVGLSGIQSVRLRYRNERKCRCRNQSGTGIMGPSPVPVCSGPGLRYRIPECRCRRHRPRYRCPAMTNTNKLLPFIYIKSPASPASSNICQCNSHVSHCSLFNVTKIINNRKSGM